MGMLFWIFSEVSWLVWGICSAWTADVANG